MHRVPNETMKRIPVPPSSSSMLNLPLPAPPKQNPVGQDLLWISKQQQQHPSMHVHPLKNSVRVASNGIRHKFDGKQWRPLCASPDGFECRNIAFRSSLCQKHFYKVHLFKRPYAKTGSMPPTLPGIPPVLLKRPLPAEYEHHHQEQNSRHDEYEEIYEDDDDDDDSIEVIEDNDVR
jgi:hypothetical protein